MLSRPTTRLFSHPVSQGSKHQAHRCLIWARLEFDKWFNYVNLFFTFFFLKQNKPKQVIRFSEGEEAKPSRPHTCCMKKNISELCVSLKKHINIAHVSHFHDVYLR